MKKKSLRSIRSPSKGMIVGRAAAAKISAVEGIVLSTEMRKLFRLFDEQGLSADERRRRLVERYGKKSA